MVGRPCGLIPLYAPLAFVWDLRGLDVLRVDRIGRRLHVPLEETVGVAGGLEDFGQVLAVAPVEAVLFAGVDLEGRVDAQRFEFGNEDVVVELRNRVLIALQDEGGAPDGLDLGTGVGAEGGGVEGLGVFVHDVPPLVTGDLAVLVAHDVCLVEHVHVDDGGDHGRAACGRRRWRAW